MSAELISIPTRAPLLEDCAVLELRDYTMQPGRRDELITLFERAFIEAQEAVGARVVAHWRDLDRDDHYVWLRGFVDMSARREALTAFYTSPVWLAHRTAANATMIDSDNVRLLRPARPTWTLTTPPLPRPAHDAEPAPTTALHVLTLCALPAPADAAFARWFERDVLPLLREAGAMPCAVFQTEPALNDYPRLPVRTDEHVWAWLSRLSDAAAWARAQQHLQANAVWTERVLPRLRGPAGRASLMLRLQPAARSLLR